MSDYLDNLVSRTLNQTPAVKPRLASIYEPFSVSVSERDTSPFDLEIPSEEQPVKREPLTSTSHDPQLNSRLPELPEPRIGHARVSHSMDQERPGPERPGLAVDESRSIQARDPNVAFEPLPALIHSRSRRLSHEPRPGLIDETLPGLANEPAAIVDSQDVQTPNAGVVKPLTRNAQKPAPPIASSISEPDQTLASDQRLKGTLISKSQPDVPDSRNISTGKALTRLVSTQPKGHQSLEIISHQNSVSEPVPEGAGKISVTIGRVDVRAIFAQPQADRSERPKKSTAMSLDDYLKQRTGGRR